MTQTLPINIPIPSESSNALYNYTDISDGLGYVVYDGFAVENSTTRTYVLSANALSSDPRNQYVNDHAGTYTLDFKTSPFNTPRVLQGTTYFTFSSMLVSDYSPANLTIKITLIKLVGSTETELGNVTSRSFETTRLNRVMSLAVSQTNFKIGDVLMVRVLMTSTSSGSGAYQYICFYHDPMNRSVTGGNNIIDASVNPTYFKCAIPFKIQL